LFLKFNRHTEKIIDMKKTLLAVILAITLYSSGVSQTNKYWTGGSETIFSFANIDDNGSTSGNVMRFAPFLNIQEMYNIDMGKSFGVYTGVFVRNVGFIYDNYKDLQTGDIVKKKFRSYNIGVPFGLKIGKMEKFFIYAGYDLAYAFNYKEKTFQNDRKDKLVSWFGNRVNAFQHGFVVGIQFPYGMNIKFKYYLSNFHNQDYMETIDQVDYYPYKGLNANVWYISLNFNLFKNNELYITEE